MDIIGRKNDANVLSVDDDDDAFEEDGVFVLVLNGEEFVELLHKLPQEIAWKYLKIYKDANFKHHCENSYYSNGDKIICKKCNEVVVLNNREEHNKACWEAAIKSGAKFGGC